MRKAVFLLLLFSLVLAHATETKAARQSSDSSTQNNNKKFGIEIDPFGIFNSIYAKDEERDTFSAGINYFNYAQATEIALPIYYSHEKRPEGYDETCAFMDLRYRKFSEGEVGGSFLGIFGRYVYLDGKPKNDTRLARVHKFGLGLEVGYRQIINLFNLPLYWGMSFGFGRYFGDDSDLLTNHSLVFRFNDSTMFADVELFKFGYRF